MAVESKISVQYLEDFQTANTLIDKRAIAEAWTDACPQDAAAWFMLGEVERQFKHISKAIAAYMRAVKLQPDDVGSLGRLADLHFQQGAYLDSMVFYDRLLKLDVPPEWALVGAGNLYERLGLVELAFNLFIHVVRDGPDERLDLLERTLKIFGKLAQKDKQDHAVVIAQLIGMLDGDIKHSDNLIHLINLTSKTCQALVFCDAAHRDELRPAESFLYPSKPDTSASGWSSVVENKLLAKLVFSVTGICNGQLNANLSGWCGKTLTAQLHIDGVIHGDITFTATGNKEYGGLPLTACAELPAQILDAKPHVYFITLKFGRFRLQSEPQTLAYPDFRLHIDSANLTSVSGWGFKTESSLPLSLRAVLDQEEKCNIELNLPRQDVLINFPKAPNNSGFVVVLPEPTALGYRLDIYDDETGIHLSRMYVANPYALFRQTAGEWALSKDANHQLLLNSMAPSLVNSAQSGLSIRSEFIPSKPIEADHTEVAVLIPVYEGLEATIECIESVLASDNKTPSRIIIINDHSPNAGIQGYLKDLQEKGVENLLVVHRYRNGGFSEAVNLGMLIAGMRDVILLNSDTVVQHGWIDRLVTAARSDALIGTVTPLSNNAEICTVPYSCKTLAVNEYRLAVEVDQTAAVVNSGRLVDIPVAIGFCMLIKRRCIQDVGLFDAATWGRGYGEEVDFCLKAVAKGWRHVLATDTFVVHRGNVSFGDEKLIRIQESAKKISERYPFYNGLIQQFIARDPVNADRRNLNIGLIQKVLPGKRILHITHSFGGGTEQYLKDQTTFNREEGCCPITLRFDQSGQVEMTVELDDTGLSGFFSDVHKECYSPREFDTLRSDLSRLGIDQLHLHAPFGMPMSLLEWLVTTFPTTITVHDYAWICPRVTLTQAAGRYCAEPPPDHCNRCINVWGNHKGLQHFVTDSQNDVAAYRKAFGQIFEKADVILAGAQDVVNRMRRHGIEGNYKVLPHPHPEGSLFHKQVKVNHSFPIEGVVKVALIGGISDIKGYYQLIECAEHVERKRLPIEFIIFGTTQDNNRLLQFKSINVLGPYKEEELEGLMLTYQPHVSFFPNQSPETYSYTLTHALRFGLHPIVTDIGAPAERISNSGIGSVVPLGMSAEEVCEVILKSVGSI
jgi:GT2 family glycosyltransferase